MNIRPLVIAEAQKEDIRRVVSFAFGHPISLEMMKSRNSPRAQLRYGQDVSLDRANDPTPSFTDMPQHWCMIPLGYKVCFSVEEQPEPLSWCRHISISVTEKGKWPNELAVQMIIEEFGFRGHILKPAADGTLILYQEKEFQAINVIEKLTEDEAARV